MNYQRHYDALIQRAKWRVLDGYAERHHVVPKCMGGGDEAENLVLLTAEEHYVAHQLLVKIFPGERKIVYAAWAMTHGKWRSNKKYGWLKRKRAEAQRGTKHTPEARRKISEKAKGRTLTPERREQLLLSRKGKKNTDEHNRKVAESLRGKKKSESHLQAIRESRAKIVYTPELREKMAYNRGKKLNEKQKAALLAATKGKPLSEEHKAKVSAAKKGKTQPMLSCPHCPKTGGSSLMKRWHFDNCKVNHGRTE